ncbi:hypothetical protein KXD40_004052 [Peronospora effusa]|uniref:Uncharacterized protein n=1 Tax=Peronospora effusa TaxID=542832 RepID=A0A3M6VUH7_9STRA|nr:hypothetical protein DD238_000430 [Peronospora effusa]RQM16609.1 hypothetical protein DD237_001246 [Peronospora effusa]UIZ22836.1 hypothetical protein KXD40_004052 [Peronospora effusa]CAI5702956.1 unnamed protein product [Peronospora effusa]
MLNAISLSEEELGMLFGPALHGAVSTSTPTLRNRKALRQAPVKRMANKTTRAAKAKPNTTHRGVIPARCGYRTGKCQNLQAFKRNGKLHKLCEFHRERANLNQKKLDRKKRMQRSKHSPSRSSCKSVTSKDKDKPIKNIAKRSPRTVEAAVTNSVFKTESKMELDDFDMELVLPTNLHEAPLALGCEELAIFCSLMTFDVNHRAPISRDSTPVHTPSNHYYTSCSTV